jgi:hypothetical protein
MSAVSRAGRLLFLIGFDMLVKRSEDVPVARLMETVIAKALTQTTTRVAAVKSL